MSFAYPKEVLLERYITLISEQANAASIPEIKDVLIEAHDKLCALRKPATEGEAA